MGQSLLVDERPLIVGPVLRAKWVDLVIGEDADDSADEDKGVLLQHEDGLEYKGLVEFQQSQVGLVELVQKG